ncbi:XIAP-associated factor 1-like isoform X1 [Acipenser ruthenus]|uniref:XIAP-associated factor 1-like isoform X1 n=1 Tax=Acipenser ruthenus TaxID=7906 RepID=UPI002741757C|nr:XIAP-associated factor 1-like isoform X1 [Acipenser ruthenus]XP_058853984.1 XIAP-associated factor 1-like isoform X1 [Acipenser ruthenus]
MEGSSEETTLCKNCKKEVLASNFSLHESHCWRFLSVCPLCDEPVPKDQLQEHRDTEHCKVRCTQCNKEMEKCKLEIHQSEQCAERLVSCEFCDLELPLSKLQEHGDACGSRTQRCPDCDRYVMHREQERHSRECRGKREGAEEQREEEEEEEKTYTFYNRSSAFKFPCWYCMKSFPEEELNKHQLDCSRPSRHNAGFRPTPSPPLLGDPRPHFGVPRSSRSPTFPLWGLESPDREDRETEDEIMTCSNCHLALPSDTLRWHQSKCLLYDGLRNPVEK